MKIYKVYCECCGVVTPQIDNTCTWRCQRCFSANSFSNLADGEWTGEELKAFYEQYPQDWNMSARAYAFVDGKAVEVATVDLYSQRSLDTAVAVGIAAPLDKFPLTVNGKTHWMDYPAQKVHYVTPQPIDPVAKAICKGIEKTIQQVLTTTRWEVPIEVKVGNTLFTFRPDSPVVEVNTLGGTV